MKRFGVVASVVLLATAMVAIYVTQPAWTSRASAQEDATSRNPGAPSIGDGIDAASPVIFSYQGQLTTAAGTPVNNSSVSMTFRLYKTFTGGTACWSETQTVNVQNGQFSVLLGTTSAISASCLTGTNYLELVVGGETLSPREVLASVPYSVQANSLPADAKIGNSPVIAGDIIAGAPGNEFIFHTRYGNNSDFLEITSRDSGGGWKWGHGIVLVDATGNVGIGTNNPQRRLDVVGDTRISGNLYAGSAITSPGGSDLTIDAGWGSTNDVRMLGGLNLLNSGGADDIRMGGTTAGYTVLRRDGNRVLHFVPWGGPSHRYDEICIGCGSGNVNFRVNGYLHIEHGRALVRDSGDVLNVNYGGDFSGGTRIQSSLSVWGPAVIAGDLNVDRTINAAGLNVGSCHINTSSRANTTNQTECEGGTITSGAYVEANLMTNEERLTEKIDRFEQGDLLCWSDSDQQLELCAQEDTPLVMAVADANGKPIVLGAEQIKVIGPVQTGDYLVASDVPGYAMANKDPSFGIVIGQALEGFEGEQGLIMAMIRKM